MWSVDDRRTEMHESLVERLAGRTVALSLAALLAGCGGAATGLPTASTVVSTDATKGPTPTAAATEPSVTPVVITPTGVAEGEPLKELWTYEGSPASYAWAPAIDPDGKIWVAALALNEFWVLDRDGKLVETWGKSGSGDGQLSIKGSLGQVFGSIAFAPDRSFIVGDAGNRRVQLFDANRHFVRAFGTFGTADGQFAVISGVAVAPDGSIVVDDNDRLDVQVFDPSGAHLRTICPETSGPIAAVDASGTTWCLDDDQLQAWGTDGTMKFTVDLRGIITLGIGLAVAPNGHLFVASVNPEKGATEAPERLLELDANGTLLHVWPTGGEGIAVDPAGDRIYVASIDLKRVRAYALPGS